MIALAWLAAACNGGGDCVSDLDPDCTPAFTPTFEEIHRRTLTQSCAIAGASCHATAGSQGGLALEDIDVAYRALVDDGRVIANDAACSLMVMRIEADDGTVMPPANPLRAAERCAIATWIREGAQR
ncbi:MAG: c-type cytochrome domain-containing protein [Deltaproteobacteria bacterium]